MNLADDPEDVIRSQHVVRQAALAVHHAVGRSPRAEARPAADEAKAVMPVRAVGTVRVAVVSCEGPFGMRIVSRGWLP